jgi:hypothetical protein
MKSLEQEQQLTRARQLPPGSKSRNNKLEPIREKLCTECRAWCDALMRVMIDLVLLFVFLLGVFHLCQTCFDDFSHAVGKPALGQEETK